MSFEITTAFTKQFKDNIRLLSQQEGSMLEMAVDVENDLTGDAFFFEQMGSVEARDKTVRFQESPQMDTPHRRRMVTPNDADWGDFIDKIDKVKMLISPESKYIKQSIYAMGRKIDDHIIEAATGTAMTGKNGATPIVLPSTQKLNVTVGGSGSSTGMNVAKLIAAKSLFGKNEVNIKAPDNKLYFVHSQQQLDDLLAVTQTTSTDYAAIKALVNGEITYFMGFEFINIERLGLDGDDIRTCFAFAKSGIGLGKWADIQTEVSKRSDRSYAWYAYTCMSVGATRLEEEKVVEIPCDESP